MAGADTKGIIYLTSWWSWRLAWPIARQRRSWSPPLVSWMCDVSWADYEYPGNGPGRWSTCALYSPSTPTRRTSRIRCTTPRRTANTLKIWKYEKPGCQVGAKRCRVIWYELLRLSIIQASKLKSIISQFSYKHIRSRMLVSRMDEGDYEKDGNFIVCVVAIICMQ